MTTAAPAAETGSNFFLGFAFLPKAKKEALSAVYAYCRLIDDIVDTGSIPKEEAAKLLGFWRDEIGRLYAGEPTHPVASRLLPAVRGFSLPKDAFLEMIRGCEMDLNAARYQTFAELESYMQGVACSVGKLSVEIFGYAHTDPESMAEFSKLFGYAFQLTNIIRDVGADLEMGRVYLPEEDMKEAGYTREALIRRDHSLAFDRLMELEYRRAKQFYQRGRNMVDFRDRPNLLPAEIMAHIYEGLLDEIKATEYRVLFQRSSLPTLRKLGLAFKAWLYCHGIHG
ncbi:MAG: squalene/phytoene synthase family protein [Elusimicrobia bacterium]|nr:squalene/phytoene synthase family protein [Elusimicrobiota bacterium]